MPLPDHHDASLDNPIEQFEHDAFNRRPFSERLAATIAGLPSENGSPVLGLYGKWGYGKSTVLNFVRLALRERASEKFEIFAFNPWLFRDQSALLEEFFLGLATAFEAAIDKEGAKIGSVLARYSGAFGVIPLVGGAIEALIKNGGEDLAADTLLGRRNRLVEAMRAADKKVVVLIDDLDRLDRDEVLTMLKLVRLSANFPNVIYLLAFDEGRVARLAGSVYGAAADDGRQFLEKIVQYPFTLPAVGATRLARYVLTQVKIACDAAQVHLTEEEWTRFRHLCRGALLMSLTTPRQAVRYGNALRFALPLLKGEVDPFDQMVIEAARILSPEFYDFLRDQPDPTKLNQGMTGPRPFTPLEDALLGALCRFGPRSSKPISDPRYHDRYFSYAVATDDLSDTETATLLELASCGCDQELMALLARLVATKFDAIVERLDAAFDNLDLKRADRLALTLAGLATSLKAKGLLNVRDQRTELAELVAKLAVHWLPLRTDRSLQVADKVLDAASPIAFALQVWEELQRAAHTDDNKAGTLDWDALRVRLLTRVRGDIEPHPLEGGERDVLRLLQFWQRSDPNNLFATLTERIRTTPGDAFDFLALWPDQQVNFKWIAEMCDPEIIIAVTDPWTGPDPHDDTVSADKIMAARFFKQEYELRQ